MKILILGVLALAGWCAIATHIWICNVLGLCNETITLNSDIDKNSNLATTGSLNKTLNPAKPVIPGNLLIYFEFDKSDFKADSMMERYSSLSKSYLDVNSGAVMNITGYTDSIGSDNYNQELGYRRARSLQLFFNTKGLQTDRVLIGSKGEKDPAAKNNTSRGRANNRRAEITIKN